MKRGYIISIFFIVFGVYLLSEKSKDNVIQNRITTDIKKTVKLKASKGHEVSSEKRTHIIDPEVTKSSAQVTSVDEDIREQKEVTKETENDFKSLKIPEKFSETKEIRYKEIMEIYQKTSFYLSEIASGNIQPEKSNLKKAFTGLSVYLREVNPSDGLEDDALVMIEENYPANFEEALKEMPRKDELLIRKILKLQKESE